MGSLVHSSKDIEKVQLGLNRTCHHCETYGNQVSLMELHTLWPSLFFTSRSPFYPFFSKHSYSSLFFRFTNQCQAYVYMQNITFRAIYFIFVPFCKYLQLATELRYFMKQKNNVSEKNVTFRKQLSRRRKKNLITVKTCADLYKKDIYIESTIPVVLMHSMHLNLRQVGV